MSSRNKVFDSSAWIEILSNGPLGKICLKELKDSDLVVVPTIVLFEVYKKISQSVSEDHALSAIAYLTQHKIADLTQEVALTAADLALQYKLAMADSMVIAHAHSIHGMLITLDNDFSGVPLAKVLK